MGKIRILTSEEYFEDFHDQRAALEEKAMREEKYYLMFSYAILDGTAKYNCSKMQQEEWGFFDSDKMVGFFHCLQDNRELTNVRMPMFYIHPDYRGQGLGHHAYETCLAWANQKQFLTAQGHIHPLNTASIALAQKHGFHLFAETVNKITWADNSQAHCQIYRRNLQPNAVLK